MGNRAAIVFFDRHHVSPTVYLHWHGEYVPAWLGELKELMQTRRGDASYAAARFAGICHGYVDGNLSLGIFSNHLTLAMLHNCTAIEAMSPGNAGIVVVDTSDFTWKAYGGYLANPHTGKES